MRRQAEWEAHATYMDAAESDRFILAGGPLGDEDRASRVLHIIQAADRRSVDEWLAADPWTRIGLLKTVSIDPWTVLLGRLPT